MVLSPIPGLVRLLCCASEEGHWKLGGSRARTPVPKEPKDHPIPQHVMPRIGTGGSYLEGSDRCLGRAGIGWWLLSHCIVHHLCSLVLTFPFVPFSFTFCPLVTSLIIISSRTCVIMYLIYIKHFLLYIVKFWAPHYKGDMKGTWLVGRAGAQHIAL